MESIKGLIILGVLFLILVIILIKEMIDENIENESRDYELNEIKNRLEYHKRNLGYHEDEITYKIGEWEEEVRTNMSSIVKIVDYYKTNKNISILVGDYNKTSISNTTCVLESMGLQVSMAKSGVEIIKRIQAGEHYDLIISNNVYDRGDCDGPQTVQRLKELDNFNTPVIALTVSDNKRHLFIDEYNFDEYMTKLLTQQQVLNTLPKVIKDLKFTKIQTKSNKS